jgi:hypothetical protein
VAGERWVLPVLLRKRVCAEADLASSVALPPGSSKMASILITDHAYSFASSHVR